jgi:two-component system, NarL family, nitrate/nitrite response regulator NarL
MSGHEYIKPGTPLPPRERDVLILVGKGCSSKEVGRLLNMTPHTVNDHMKRIFRRLDVDTRVEAAVWAAKQGWL